MEIAEAISLYPRVAVASCNSAGKSFLAARIAVWFLTMFKPSIVITTAPTDRQVRRILWKEINQAYHKARQNGFEFGGELLTKEWRFNEDHFALGFSSSDYNATAFQGIHSPYLLVIADEGAGLTEAVWEGIFSMLKGGYHKLLTIGNPTNIEGQFYQAFKRENWWTTSVSAFDTPNLQGNGIVVPGLITEEDIENARLDWGEDSPLFKSRILGQFPESISDTFIPLHILDQAGSGEWGDIKEIDKDEPVHIAADLARYGSDENVFTARRGRLGYNSDSFGADQLGSLGIMTAAGRLVRFTKESLDMLNARKSRVIIKCDAVGLGGGVPDRLREMKLTGEIPRNWLIYDMSAGAAAKKPDKFINAGTEWWKGLADKLKQEQAFGPIFENKKAQGQLSSRRYEFTSADKVKLESKDKVKARGLPSPDWGDSIAMLYVEQRYNKAQDEMQGVGESYAREAINW